MWFVDEKVIRLYLLNAQQMSIYIFNLISPKPLRFTLLDLKLVKGYILNLKTN